MKIGVIGLGHIAQKAYLPIYSQMQAQAAFILASTNEKKRQALAKQYGFSQTVANVDELIAAGIQACFVHVATHAHYAIVKQLLQADIHVYVDKPLSEDLHDLRQLVALAKQKKRLLMIGMNRRFVPFVTRLKQVPKKNLLLLQKQRVHHAQPTRFVIFDEFLHLVDTMVYLLDDDILQVQSKILEQGNTCQRAFLQVETLQTTAICVMNLVSDANQECYQLMSETGTYLVKNLATFTTVTKTQEQTELVSDWLPTLEKRGFVPMIQSFIQAITTQHLSGCMPENSVLSHELCEEMLRKHLRSRL